MPPWNDNATRRGIVRALAVVVAVATPAVCNTALAQAPQVGFSCPKEGVIVEGALGKTIYHGAEPGDPILCRLTNVRGQTESRPYNFYIYDTKDIRQGLGDVISGRKQSATFHYTYKYGPKIEGADDTWTRLGAEDINIGKRAIKAIVFEREEKSTTTSFHGKWKLWFDPGTGLWVKGVYTHIDGFFPQNPNWQLTNVTIP
jgi:hypothetical protein